MADKYPELDVNDSSNVPVDVDTDINADVNVDADFLAREQEVLGDEFKTEQDSQVLAESDDEIQEFKEQFPEVGDATTAAPSTAVADEGDDDDDFEAFGSAAPAESVPLTEWRQRRDLEIEEREKVNARTKSERVAAAQQNIDDFYDNYNAKREQHTKEVEAEQAAFVEKRDGFLGRGTLWDRVGELVAEVGELPEDGRDKSRFKGLLTKLGGKENVPGAGGY